MSKTAVAAVLLAAGALLAATSPAGAGTPGEIRGYAAKCAGGGTALRAKIQIADCMAGASQQWSFTGGELKRAGMCMNDQAWAGPGGKVILWPCTGAPNETWSPNATGEYVLKANGLCLDDPAYSVRNGTQLIVYRCNGGANQRWSLPFSPLPSPAPAPTDCHPLTSSGNCYEPGEFCSTADHGVTGVAGDGEAIICEDNGGWRWEPA